MAAGKVILIDRDGVINVDSVDYIRTEQQWQAIPGSLEAMGRLYRNGWRLVVITNQAGIGRGLMSVEDLNAVHARMCRHLAQYGGVIEAILFCPHTPEDNCACRKPKPGMFREVARRLRIQLKKVIAVGDKLSDIQAALEAGADPVLVRTGYGQAHIDAREVPDGVRVFDDLAAVADALLDPVR